MRRVHVEVTAAADGSDAKQLLQLGRWSTRHDDIMENVDNSR